MRAIIVPFSGVLQPSMLAGEAQLAPDTSILSLCARARGVWRRLRLHRQRCTATLSVYSGFETLQQEVRGPHAGTTEVRKAACHRGRCSRTLTARGTLAPSIVSSWLKHSSWRVC
jgi:hypothetical protein